MVKINLIDRIFVFSNLVKKLLHFYEKQISTSKRRLKINEPNFLQILFTLVAPTAWLFVK